MTKIADIMVDLETLGVGTNPVIAQIAAVPFQLETGAVPHLELQFNQFVCPRSCLNAGLKIDPSTMEWWAKQEERVYRDIIVNAFQYGLELKSALESFNVFIDVVKDHYGVKQVRIWGNGMLADNRWLMSAYEAIDLKPGWKYNEDSDVRTLVDLGRRFLDIDPKKDFPFEGNAHNAIDDCLHQIRYVCEIAKRLAAPIKMG